MGWGDIKKSALFHRTVENYPKIGHFVIKKSKMGVAVGESG